MRGLPCGELAAARSSGRGYSTGARAPTAAHAASRTWRVKGQLFLPVGGQWNRSRGQPITATRAAQQPRGQLPLDPVRVNTYHEHRCLRHHPGRAPSTNCQEERGGPCAYRHPHAGAYPPPPPTSTGQIASSPPTAQPHPRVVIHDQSRLTAPSRAGCPRSSGFASVPRAVLDSDPQPGVPAPRRPRPHPGWDLIAAISVAFAPRSGTQVRPARAEPTPHGSGPAETKHGLASRSPLEVGALNDEALARHHG